MSVTSQRPDSAVPADHWRGSGMIPRLESGDRLTADEFMGRYEAMPDLKVASPERSGALARPGGIAAG